MNRLPTPSRPDRAASWYADATWLRALVGAVPYVGGSIDLVFGSRGQRLARERIERMLSTLGAEMYRVEAHMVRQEFLESEEWADLVRLAVERATRTRSERHLKGIANILRGSAVGAIPSEGHAETLIDVLAELREEEAAVLRELYRLDALNPTPAVDEEGGGIPSAELSLQLEAKERVHFILRRLDTAGLVSPGPMTSSGAFQDKYRPTAVGRELCDLVYGSSD